MRVKPVMSSNSSNLNKGKSTIELFVDDFEIQNWDLSLETKQILKKSKNTFFSLYCIDFVLCHIIIGNIHVILYVLIMSYYIVLLWNTFYYFIV